MTHYIRMDFSLASAGIMRKALTLAYHHVSHRRAFGKRISDQPQMINALADLAIESEAALLLAMRMVSAADAQGHSTHDANMLRVGVPISKFWNCKRVNHVVLEALECHGGMGSVEEQAIARLLREAPLNSIWEGTSAMMGLDFNRALRREPGTKEALLTEMRSSKGTDSRLDNYISTLETELNNADNDLEPHARRLMAKSAMALQASLLVRHSTQEVAELFIASRMGGEGPMNSGRCRWLGRPCLALWSAHCLSSDVFGIRRQVQHVASAAS
ncbi:acyl-CoA dehydrogenase family protein [Bradyrhizobium sp. RDT10]